MPRFRAGATNVFLYHPSKRQTRKGNKVGSWVHGSNALIVVTPDLQLNSDPKDGLKFGGRELVIDALGGRFVVVQHGSDAIGG